MDNYQTFMDRFRAYFRDPISAVTASDKIWLLQQNKDFKMWGEDTYWNEVPLIDKFRQGLTYQLPNWAGERKGPTGSESVVQMLHYHRFPFRRSANVTRTVIWARPGSCFRKIAALMLTTSDLRVGKPTQLVATRKIAAAEERQRGRNLFLLWHTGTCHQSLFSKHPIQIQRTHQPGHESNTPLSVSTQHQYSETTMALSQQLVGRAI